jgi:putative oxidoreductase
MASEKVRSFQSVGISILRIAVGVVFLMHGYQKFFDIGIGGITQGFTHGGIPYPHVSAILASLAEFGGGILLILGLFTRLAAIPPAIVMIVAFATVHGKNGFFLGNPPGFEYVFTLFFALVALMLLGAGPIGLDRLIHKR